MGERFGRRGWRRRLAWWLAVASFLYVGTLLVLLALEDRLLFAGASFPRPTQEPPAWLNARELMLASSDGAQIHAWFTAPDGWKPEQGAVLYSHGNSRNLTPLVGRAFRWREQLHRAVVVYDYPGYGNSSGRPSEKGCYAAGECVFRWLVEEQKIPPSKMIFVGESMGGAIATELALRRGGRLLVLHGAFTSFPDMAQTRFPIFPGRYLVHNRMDNEAKIGRVRCPVFITHGTADRVVPYCQGEWLYEAAQEPKRFQRLEGHGHNPPNTTEFFEVVQELLDETDTPAHRLLSSGSDRKNESGPLP